MYEELLEHRAQLSQLDPKTPPLDVPQRRWERFLVDARAFYAEDPGWALLAADLGWTWEELIGADATKPWARIDRLGMLWLANGNIIEDIDDAGATLVSLSGGQRAARRYRRVGRPTGSRWILLPWELGRNDER